MKRITGPLGNLNEIAKRVRQSEVHYWNAFLKRRHTYVQKINENPSELPKINWDYYRNNISTKNISAMDRMKVSYEGFKIPFPIDSLTKILDDDAKAFERELKTFCADSMIRIDNYKFEKKFFEEMLPYEDMTYEEYADIFPEISANFLERPTYWPHTLEEQLDSIDPNSIESSH